MKLLSLLKSSIKIVNFFNALKITLLFPFFIPTASAVPSTLHSHLPEVLFPSLAHLIENIDLEQEDLALEVAHCEEDIVHSQRGLRIEGHVSAEHAYLIREDDIPNENNNPLLGGFTAKQPLYHWGALSAETKRAKLHTKKVQLHRHLVHKETLQKIRESYLDLLLIHIKGNNEEKRQKSRKELLQKEQERHERGHLSREALELLKLDVLQGEIEVRSHQLTVKQKRHELSSLTGLLFLEELPITVPPIELSSSEIKTLRELFERESFADDALEAFEIEKKREKKFQVILRAQTLPKINLIAGVRQTQIQSPESATVANCTVLHAGICVHWNIFDHFETRSRLRKSSATLRQIERAKREKYENLSFERKHRLEELFLVLEHLNLQEKRLEQAAQSLHEQEVLFKREELAEREWQDYSFTYEDVLLQTLQARVHFLKIYASVLSLFHL